MGMNIQSNILLRRRIGFPVFLVTRKKRRRKFIQPPAFNRSTQILHQLLVEGEIMPCQQHGSKHLIRLEQVVQIGAAIMGAGRAWAAFL